MTDDLHCPYCSGVAVDLAPTDDALAAFGCASCGMTFSRALAEDATRRDAVAAGPRMKTGDRVTIICQGSTVVGEVLFASANAKSLMLTFEAILADHVGSMPVLMDGDGVYRSVFNAVEVILAKGAEGA